MPRPKKVKPIKVQAILADYNRAHFSLLQFLDKIVEEKIREVVKPGSLKK